MNERRYRQVHLDFHTSADCEGVGADFDPEVGANVSAQRGGGEGGSAQGAFATGEAGATQGDGVMANGEGEREQLFFCRQLPPLAVKGVDGGKTTAKKGAIGICGTAARHDLGTTTCWTLLGGHEPTALG